MKVVINTCNGGFGLSEAAYKDLGLEWDKLGTQFANDRSNPALVACVEKLGDDASDSLSRLKVVEVPDDVKWEIHDYDGVETVREVSREWSYEEPEEAKEKSWTK